MAKNEGILLEDLEMEKKRDWIIEDNICIAYNKINRDRFDLCLKFVTIPYVRKAVLDISKKENVDLLTASKMMKDKLWEEHTKTCDIEE